jgi:hypothetical protein
MILGLFGEGTQRELAVGIETPYEARRMELGKGLPDRTIFELGKKLTVLGWSMRGYFIHGLLEHTPEARLRMLGDSVDFMRDIGEKTSVWPSILILRAYVPEARKDDPLFRGDFAAVNDAAALAEFKAIASRSRGGVVFDIDPTSEDQMAAGAALQHEQYTAAVRRYCATLNPNELVLR